MGEQVHDGFFDAPKPAGKLKHAILRQYLLAWLSILSRAARGGNVPELHYVDTHAGRGTYGDGSLGSPLLALEAAKSVLESQTVLFEFSAHFLEVDPKHANALTAEIERRWSNVAGIRATVVPRDSLEHLDRVLTAIPAGAPTFVFMDPFGYKDHIAADRVLSVLRGRRMTEVFLTFMSGFVAPYLRDATKHTTFDRLMGTRAWRDFREAENRERHIVKLYSDVLMADEANITGNSERLLAFPIELKPPQGKSPYYLVHISQNAKGRFEMERAATKLHVEGVKSWPLFASQDAVSAVEDVLKSLRPGKDRVRVLYGILGPLWRRHPLIRWDPDIIRALQLLYNDGVIEVRTQHDRLRNKNSLPRETDLVSTTGVPRTTAAINF